MPVDHLCVFFGETSIQVFCPVFNCWAVVCFSILSCVSSLYVLDINPLSGLLFAKILPPVNRLPYVLLIVSFIVQKLFTLTQSYFTLLLFSLPEKTYPKNTAKTSVKECTACVSFWQFYGFRSYIVIFSTL